MLRRFPWPRLLTILIASVVVVLVVASVLVYQRGRAELAAEAAAPQPMTRAIADPMTPSSDNYGLSPHPGRVLRLDQTHGLTSMSWRLLSLAKDGRSVSIVADAGDGCARNVGFTIETNAKHRLMIAAWSTSLGSGSCNAKGTVAVVNLPFHYPASRSIPLIHAPALKTSVTPLVRRHA